MSQVKMDGIGWQEGEEDDFSELHEAIRAGKVSKFNRNDLDEDEVSSDGDDDEEEDPGPKAHPGERLLWAAQNNRLELVDELLPLRKGLINYRDSDGYTALHRASYSNHPEMVLKLLERGADVAAETSEDQWKPLHSACRWNAAACAEILMAWGADVNALTQGNQTPLHLAAFAGNSRDTLQLLIMHPDLNPLSFNCQQDTAKDIALRNGNCVDLFELVQPHVREGRRRSRKIMSK